jgi:transposase
MLFSGIDLHRRSIAICTLDENGSILQNKNFKNNKIDIINYFDQWNTPHQAVVECTSGWYWLCDLLNSIGIDVLLAHAKYLKAISYAKVKTDAIDAHTLAQLLRMDYIPEAYQIPFQYRAIRDILRQRMTIEYKRLKTSNQIASILAQFNILAADSQIRLPEFIKCILNEQIPEQYQLILTHYHQQIQLFVQQKKSIEKYFKTQLNTSEDLKLLLSIPGIGPITGAIILSETGDINRFVSDKHYCSYCRLVPGAKNSGNRRAHRSGSKDGNKYLKFAFYEAALKAIRFYQPIQTRALRIEKRANKKIARTVIAKELAKIAYYVLTKQQPFRWFKGTTIRKNRLGLTFVSPSA